MVGWDVNGKGVNSVTWTIKGDSASMKIDFRKEFRKKRTKFWIGKQRIQRIAWDITWKRPYFVLRICHILVLLDVGARRGMVNGSALTAGRRLDLKVGNRVIEFKVWFSGKGEIMHVIVHCFRTNALHFYETVDLSVSASLTSSTEMVDGEPLLGFGGFCRRGDADWLCLMVLWEPGI